MSSGDVRVRQGTSMVSANQQEEGRQVQLHWEKPRKGWIKLNCDGTFDSRLREAGFGISARDFEGRMLNGYGKTCNTSSAEKTEALAVKEAIAWAAGKGRRRIVVAMDSEVVFKAFNHKDGICDWQIYPFVREIKAMQCRSESLHISVVRRKANQCANGVAELYERGRVLRIGQGTSLLRYLLY